MVLLLADLITPSPPKNCLANSISDKADFSTWIFAHAAYFSLIYSSSFLHPTCEVLEKSVFESNSLNLSNVAGASYVVFLKPEPAQLGILKSCAEIESCTSQDRILTVYSEELHSTIMEKATKKEALVSPEKMTGAEWLEEIMMDLGTWVEMESKRQALMAMLVIVNLFIMILFHKDTTREVSMLTIPTFLALLLLSLLSGHRMNLVKMMLTTTMIAMAVAIFSISILSSVHISGIVTVIQTKTIIMVSTLTGQMTMFVIITMITMVLLLEKATTSKQAKQSLLQNRVTHLDPGRVTEHYESAEKKHDFSGSESQNKPRGRPLLQAMVVSEVSAWVLRRLIAEKQIAYIDSDKEKVVTSKFYVNWSPKLFLDEQFPPGKESSDLGNAVTISGTAEDAQALTCSDYLRQTWPSTGLCVLDLIKQVIELEEGVSATCRRSNGTKLKIWLKDRYLMLKVTGARLAIAEIAEQMAWLGSALRSNTSTNSPILCKPSIRNLSKIEKDPADHNTPRENSAISRRTRWLWPNNTEDIQKTKLHDLVERILTFGEIPFRFEIDFCSESITTDVLGNGCCWHRLFRKSVIARGSRTRPRPQTRLGLEISLSIMAAALGTRYLNRCGAYTVVKGFSTMLVPSNEIDGVVLWHFYHKSSYDEYISVDDHALNIHKISYADVAQKSYADLAQARHIIGWCNEAAAYMGTPEAEYSVRTPHLRPVPQGSIFEGSRVTMPQTIIKTSAILTNDQRTHETTSEEYPNIFRRLTGTYFLLYDVQDKRGWIVDGVSCLLHLVLASIKHDEEISFGSDDFLFNWSELKKPTNAHGVGAARRFLGSRENRSAKIFITGSLNKDRIGGETECEILSDRMVKMYHVMNEMLRYQLRFKARSPMPRRVLEGWDFSKLTKQTNTLRPSALTLDDAALTWVDFTRSLGMVTLFGNGFGELIRPVSSTACCAYWSRLPTMQSYLAVRVSDLEAIMKDKGDQNAHPKRLTRSIVWHNPCSLLGSCGCHDSEDTRSNNVQVAWPKRMVKSLSGLCQPVNTSQCRNGAVVFGHNAKFGWHWNDTGDPIEGQAPLPMTETRYSSDESILEEDMDESDSSAETSEISTLNTSAIQNNDALQTINQSKMFGNSVNSGGSHHFGDSFKYEEHHHYPSPIHNPNAARIDNPKASKKGIWTQPSFQSKIYLLGGLAFTILGMTHRIFGYNSKNRSEWMNERTEDGF